MIFFFQTNHDLFISIITLLIILLFKVIILNFYNNFHDKIFSKVLYNFFLKKLEIKLQ